MPIVNSTIKTKISKGKTIPVKVSGNSALSVSISSKPSTGTYNYNNLINQPSINNIILQDNKTSDDLRLQGKMEAMTVQEVQSILYNNEQRRRNNG